MKYLLIAGGKIGGFEKIKDIDLFRVICVDKGCEFAIKNNINIYKAIGDFDSIDKKSYQFLKDNNIELLSLDRDKDKSDLEISLDYIEKDNPDKVVLLGATGTRLDHSFSNLFLLTKYKNFNSFKIIDNNNIIFFADKDTKIDFQNSYISFLPAEENTKISLTGSKWEISNHLLEFGSTRTISNEFLGDIYLKIHQGSVFVFLSND